MLNTVTITKISILSAVAALLMYIETPLPLAPVFLKMDVSEIPVLLGAFSLGPSAGIIIELIKNLIHLLSTQTFGVGEMANFIVGSSMILPAGIIYKKYKSRQGAFIGLLTGIISMVLCAAFFNYYILIPLYETAFGIQMRQIILLGSKANENIVDLKSLIIYGIMPFNFIKGIVISLVTLLIYKKVSPILHK